MTEVEIAALIGVGGSVLVAIVSFITQHLNTKAVINSEKENILDQISLTEISRAREKKIDRILDGVSELLITSDPQSSDGVDYGRTTNLIIRVQLLLDLRNPIENSLNLALNDLGLSLHEYYPVRGKYIDEKSLEIGALLEAHSLVIENMRKLLQFYYAEEPVE